MGHDEDRAKSSLRFSLGHSSTPSDVDALIDAIGPAVTRARSARRATA
jgi:cysteine desulfurase